MNSSDRKQRFKKISLHIGMALLLIAVLALHVVADTMFSGLLTGYLGTVGGSTNLAEEAIWYESEFSDAGALYEYEEKLCAEIAAEGVVLLKNEDGMLPFAENEVLSLFGSASVDLVFEGSGSGSGSKELAMDLKSALIKAGLLVNEALWNFYESGNGAKDEKGNAYGIGEGSINYGDSYDWSINECPPERIQGEEGLEETFAGTTAVYVIGRTGGEDGDLPRDMEAYGGKAGQHYLELDETEKSMLSYLNETFEEILVIVNTNNAMELGELLLYENIKSILYVPGLGRTGVCGLACVLAGEMDGEEISPSGHLTDTFVYDNFSSPAMQNMGDFRYTGTDYTYVSYSEGIYVGYRYYETRYEDVITGRENAGDYDYENTVLYPFGYGLSYTTFEWSDFTLTPLNEKDEITASLLITNTGTRSGREVVQLYFQSPYTEYDMENGVEKASVELAGFAKTANLSPGESETVEITFSLEEFKAYDASGYGTYILDAGVYYITAAADAHAAVNQILAAKGYETGGDAALVGSYLQEELDALTYAVGSESGSEVTNLFSDAALEDAAYLTRSNWVMMDNDGLRYGEAGDQENPMEIGGVAFEHEASLELLSKLASFNSGNPCSETIGEIPSLGENHGVELSDLRGKDYDDPLWEELLSQLTLEEVRRIVYVNGFCALGEIKSVNKPTAYDNDGPAGLTDLLQHEAIATSDTTTTMGWGVEVLLACTWNNSLARRMGECIGEDGLYSGTTGWYGPAVNIHRTPFGGRNFEYYSEDPFLSGSMATSEVEGAASKGLVCYLKHFALNEQETNRQGVTTWANEQSIREIYLASFEKVIREAEMTISYIDSDTGETKSKKMSACAALMTSYNRIGATWSGGSYALITSLLRTEWGYEGLLLTDYNYGQSYMDTEQMLLAGADVKLRTMDFGFFTWDLAGDALLLNCALEAAHRYLFAQANSVVMNGIVHGTRIREGIPVYRILLALLEGALLLWMLLSFMRRRKRRRSMKKEMEPADKE